MPKRADWTQERNQRKIKKSRFFEKSRLNYKIKKDKRNRYCMIL